MRRARRSRQRTAWDAVPRCTCANRRALRPDRARHAETKNAATSGVSAGARQCALRWSPRSPARTCRRPRQRSSSERTETPQRDSATRSGEERGHAASVRRPDALDPRPRCRRQLLSARHGTTTRRSSCVGASRPFCSEHQGKREKDRRMSTRPARCPVSRCCSSLSALAVLISVTGGTISREVAVNTHYILAIDCRSRLSPTLHADPSRGLTQCRRVS
jgi:hypothetical protein